MGTSILSSPMTHHISNAPNLLIFLRYKAQATSSRKFSRIPQLISNLIILNLLSILLLSRHITNCLLNLGPTRGIHWETDISGTHEYSISRLGVPEGNNYFTHPCFPQVDQYFCPYRCALVFLLGFPDLSGHHLSPKIKG